MSGPKVVRIVTREEILEICRGHLARVDAALDEWTRTGRRADCIDEAALAEARRRRDVLAALIATDRFMDLQKQAPVEEAFLREDMQRRLAAAAAEQAAARSRDRREREAAATLLRTLRATSSAISDDLAEGLQRGDAAALAEGFKLLADRAQEATAVSREATARLREAEPARSFADWAARQPAEPGDPAEEAIAARLDALMPVADAEKVARLRSRLDGAVAVKGARRALLLDGLEVETGRLLTQARARATALSELEMTLAELQAAGMDVELRRAGLEELDEAALVVRSVDARDALNAHRAAQAAQARRAAVLEGLSGLGYEVTEGMSTTWVADGRLVLRSATRHDYGVELSGAGDGGRMQMRAVAFEAGGHGPDPSRDRDAETIWCGDVAGLDERLARIGGGLKIERALPVGATPLKRIAVEAPTDPGAAVAMPTLRTRSLP